MWDSGRFYARSEFGLDLNVIGRDLRDGVYHVGSLTPTLVPIV